MKRKWVLVGGIIGVVIALILLLIAGLHAERTEDLFRQEEAQDTLAEENEAEPCSKVTGYREASIDGSRIFLILNMKYLLKTEEPFVFKYTMIEDKNQTGTKLKGDKMGMVEQKGQETFYYEMLTEEIKERIDGKSYGKSCVLPYEELRYVRVLHWGFDGQTHTGELIVNKAIAEDVLAIFRELYQLQYPIERMVLVDDYGADDNLSMAANNSSAFNYRVIEGTKRISLHSFGRAIDINPLYNPYVHIVDGARVVTPAEGAEYEDRSLNCPYYIRSGDVCYQAFIKRGFTWGGDWKNNKDYQHFQKEAEEDGSGD